MSTRPAAKPPAAKPPVVPPNARPAAVKPPETPQAARPAAPAPAAVAKAPALPPAAVAKAPAPPPAAIAKAPAPAPAAVAKAPAPPPAAVVKAPESAQNARVFERFDLEVKVDLESDHNFYTGLTQNISAGGLFIATHHLRRIGDRITLKFALPGTEMPIAVETEVRWIRENSSLQRVDGATGMGVRFINLSADATAAIQKFLQSRDSLYYDDE
jgi:uncharacterized protein (TIGR02266 family)